MESIGSVMQVVTNDVAQQANEANKKQLEKQPTEKSSDVFLEALNSQGDRGALIINRVTPLFVLLIARLSGTGDNVTVPNLGFAGNGGNANQTNVPANTTVASTNPENTNNSSASGVAGVRSIPILGNVIVPNLGFAGNGGNANQTNVPATNNTTENNTTPNVNSSGVRNTPIFGNVTVPSLGTVGGGASQGAGGANSTIGSPLVRSSPVATQVGTGFQALLAGNTLADNNSSSHWRRGSSSSSSSGFNINSFFGR